MQRDHLFFGFMLGLIVPLLGILMLYTIKYMPHNVSLSEFVYSIQEKHSLIPKVISLGLIACIPLITYYKNRKKFLTLKGIFGAIIMYALVAVLYKFNIL